MQGPTESRNDPPGDVPRIALVLAGGAARGAYEVGVIHYLLEDVSRALGREVPLDILCGTSVGAINACFLAAHAGEPRRRAQRMIQVWEGLRIAHVVRPDISETFGLVRRMFSSAIPKVGPGSDRHGGVLDPTGLQRIVATAIPFAKIEDNLRAGFVQAVTVSTTHIASGRTMVWVQRRGGGLPRWSRDPTVIPRATALTAQHALASAAIPLFFPAVQLEGGYHCDGGLRQNVPLSPARRLGVHGMVVISPKFAERYVAPALAEAREELFPSPMTLVGKTLNALLLDRLDADMDRLQRMTAVLDAGTRLYGRGFVQSINQELGLDPDRWMRPVRTVLIRASKDIGLLAGEFVRAPSFSSRATGMVARVMRRLAGSEPARESDLLSYLLFDGEFCRQLIELGRADARARHEELCGFFDRLLAGDEVEELREAGRSGG